MDGWMVDVTEIAAWKVETRQEQYTTPPYQNVTRTHIVLKGRDRGLDPVGNHDALIRTALKLAEVEPAHEKAG